MLRKPLPAAGLGCLYLSFPAAMVASSMPACATAADHEQCGKGIQSLSAVQQNPATHQLKLDPCQFLQAACSDLCQRPDSQQTEDGRLRG